MPTGFAQAIEPVSATTIATGANGLTAGAVRIPTADAEMPGYYARQAAGDAFPVVLVVHEVFGIHEHIQDVCRRLAEEGYFAMAPELYARLLLWADVSCGCTPRTNPQLKAEAAWYGRLVGAHLVQDAGRRSHFARGTFMLCLAITPNTAAAARFADANSGVLSGAMRRI